MTNLNTIEMMQANDADLVVASLSGNREAFVQIVERYQTLICSLVYSSTGNLSQSEDVAQETFIAAWRQLPRLREPAKLRSWLCGIARNLAFDVLKKEGREPSHAAEPLDSICESPDSEPQPRDLAISHEEQTILWRSLERVPIVYREPLVLFYREHQSVEAVAAHLDLTEDAVKQRLSRGRKLLQEQVLRFIEGALERTSPGKTFTLGVLAVLPGLTISAKAATLGAAAAKGTVAAKTAGIIGLFGALFSSIVGFFGLWLQYRLSVETARSDRERRFLVHFNRRLWGCIGAFVLAYLLLMFCGGSLVKTKPALFVSLTIGIALAYILAIAYYSVDCYRARRKLLADLTPAEAATNPQSVVWEYRSRFHLLGLPFVHIRMGDRLGGPVKAWIAAGDCAFGVLVAFGGLAVAPVSLGGCALGLFAFGGLAIAPLVIGGMAVGIWSFGGLAIGWEAFGGCAIAWNAAWGGYAIAQHFALGGLACAAQTNQPAVQSLLLSLPFFKISDMLLPYLFWMNAAWLIPLVIQWRVIANKRRSK